MAKDKGPKSSTDAPQLRHFSQSLPMLLLRGREAVMRHFRMALRDVELTEQQWRVLRALGAVVEIEVSELARATYLLAPSLSRIVRDLERRGLITRRSDTVDLRRGLIRITRAGQKLIDQFSPLSEEIYAEIARCFGKRKLKTLQDLLRDLETSMHADQAIEDDSGKTQALPAENARSR